jgi:hypothetical protein
MSISGDGSPAKSASLSLCYVMSTAPVMLPDPDPARPVSTLECIRISQFVEFDATPPGAVERVLRRTEDSRRS